MNKLPAVLWHGKSRLNGDDILLIATHNSQNSKTGDIVQTWILPAGIYAHKAIHTGQDASVCGNCALRGHVVNKRVKNRACYVLTHNAPRSIYAKYLRGGYDELTTKQGRAALAGRVVRLGAYGDPAAVPIKVWRSLLADTAGHTGYTHQWSRFPAIAQYCIASCETEPQAIAAQSAGFRTFRIGTEKLRGESLCPASKEAGRKLTCSQ